MAKEAVNHPDHYNFGSIEVIDYIKSTLGIKGCYNFCIGNAIKYISRAEHKGKLLEDLAKAMWYIKYAKNLMEENKVDASPGDTSTEDMHIPITQTPYPYTVTPYVTWTGAASGQCSRCAYNPATSTPTVGDSPCQWCQYSPYKVTCDTETNKNSDIKKK